MDIAKGVTGSVEGGKLTLTVDAGALFLNDFKAKVLDGRVDLIKGTDLDKIVLLQAIDFILNYKKV